MFKTLETLFRGASARAEDAVTDRYAIELIDQRLREGQAALQGAKGSLAQLIQRQRAEEKQISSLDGRIAELTESAALALNKGSETLANEAASAIARMENERRVRAGTLERIESRVVRLQASVETANRRMIDLSQGAIAAKAVRKEAATQSRINKTLAGTCSMDDAEALISRVMQADDPFEQSEILCEIDTGLEGGDIAQKMADQGFGTTDKSTAASVLERLKAKQD